MNADEVLPRRHAFPGASDDGAGRVQPLDDLMVLPTPWWKRTMDVVGALLAVALLWPLMLLIAAAIRLTSRGPVLFRQRRAGLGGRPFTLYKFRSMVDGAERQRDALLVWNEQTGPVFKMRDDPRVTRVGRFLRRWSLDELPQFFNVLRGDMSLVGPRPLPVDESVGSLPWQRRRLSVAPGITCTWQVSGRSEVFYDDWVRMDLRYIAERSFWTDVRILLRTLPAVLSHNGAH